MDAPNELATPLQVANLIRQRKTQKVLASVERPVEISDVVAAANQPKVLDAIQTARWAPFHYDRAVDGLSEPWRAHVLWDRECRQVASRFYEWFDDVKPGNKIPSMLSACGAVILVTWIPQFGFGSAATEDFEEIPPPKQRSIDEEHLAATSAMIQNMLLMLTAYGMGTYWSSGGQFRTPGMFDKLGIDRIERLLGAIFVEFPETMTEEVDRVPGKHRDGRCPDCRWIRETKLERTE